MLDAAGIPEPTTVHGVAQRPIEGVSMPHVRRPGRGGTAHDAVLRDVLQPRHLPRGLDRGHAHSIPWVMAELPSFTEDTWELYDTNTDWTQAHDLAAEQPEKLEELKALFIEEARKYNAAARRPPGRALRLRPRGPVLIKGNSQLLFGGMGRLSESSVLNVKNKSHSVTAEIQSRTAVPRA